MAGIDINRTTTNVQLPAEVSGDIWAETLTSSAVMSLARQVRLPGPGMSIQTITGDAQADWVDETDHKPVSRSTFGAKTMTPYKLAVIEPFSKEFLRDLPALYAELRRRLPFALAKKFDETVFTGTAPGSGFDVLSDATATAIKPGSGANTTYKGLVAADTAVSAAGGQITGWALAPQARQYLLGAVDGQNRPLFLESTASGGRGLTLLGAPTAQTKAVYKAGSPNQIGVAGDWETALYGTVEGVEVSFSDTAAIEDGTKEYTVGENTVEIPNIVSLWGRNMVALRAEVEVGFIVRDKSLFTRLTDGTVS